MRLRREIGISLAVQGAGAASVLVATVWLGAALGPQVQGSFNRAKSALDFIGALAAFGLPQALFFHLRSGRIGLPAALRWSAGATALALPIGVAAAWLGTRPAPTDAAVPLLFGAAAAALVAQGQLRSLLLVRERATRFNLATAAPQVLTLLGVAGTIAFAARADAIGDARWFAIFLAAYGATAWAAWRALPLHPAPAAGSGADADVRLAGSLLRYGLAAWLTAALATASILGVQQWVEASAGRAALGRFTMAMTLTQVPLTPIGYAAPLLLRRWIATPGAASARRWSTRLFGGLLAVAALVGIAARWWGDLGLGPAYAGTTAALAVLLVGGAAEAASRVLAVQANASGLPGIALRAEIARAAALLVAWYLLARSETLSGATAASGWLAICAAWSAAALAAASVLAWHGGRAGGAPASAAVVDLPR